MIEEVVKPKRRAKIPVVIPYPRDLSKPKIKYNQVGVSFNPLGFKPSEDNSESSQPHEDIPSPRNSEQQKIDQDLSEKEHLSEIEGLLSQNEDLISKSSDKQEQKTDTLEALV